MGDPLKNAVGFKNQPSPVQQKHNISVTDLTALVDANVIHVARLPRCVLASVDSTQQSKVIVQNGALPIGTAVATIIAWYWYRLGYLNVLRLVKNRRFDKNTSLN